MHEHNGNEVVCGISQTDKRHVISRAMDVRTDQRVPEMPVDYAKWDVCGMLCTCLSSCDQCAALEWPYCTSYTKLHPLIMLTSG